MQIFMGLVLDSEGIVLLSPEESKHCIKVLRHKKGEIINVIDARGNFYEAELDETGPAGSLAKPLSKKTLAATKNYRLHIVISPTKNPDRIEWMIEKCTELGVDEF